MPVPLVLLRCTFEQDVILFDCTLPGLYLNGSQLPALNAARLRCNGNLQLQDGFRATGKVDLAGAKITGQLDCSGGKFSAENVALNSNAITVGASTFLRDGFTAQGTIHLTRAEIAGNLDLTGASLTKGFFAEGIQVEACFSGCL